MSNKDMPRGVAEGTQLSDSAPGFPGSLKMRVVMILFVYFCVLGHISLAPTVLQQCALYLSQEPYLEGAYCVIETKACT